MAWLFSVRQPFSWDYANSCDKNRSIRPSLGRVLVNVDISSCTMSAFPLLIWTANSSTFRYMPGTLISLALAIISKRDTRDLQLNEKQHEFRTLKKALKGVFVTLTTDPGPESEKRHRRIRDIVCRAGFFRFSRSGDMGDEIETTLKVK